ncbi:hemolysin family protein [Streptomyces sp. DSM 44915]|uniref:Hemolysin family protein n=1 Tax=Streptomyces chisholmiae TaxID=3075540 RepID=A0ABU2JUJ4_9ACTN|nr:hemolysin family protein [Streptomyces sp. DSM 44915]MDT0268660.1 hemolysin family protein [Streptomyces sp. DSM 44915]
MTEILLLLAALALVLACAIFVAAEFSLTTLDRGQLEAAAAAGERGAQGALLAVRRLTFQLSGAQLGITVASLVIGMLAEPALASLLRGPLRDLGLGGAAPSVATVLGVVLSTIVLMVIGELVPKNWAISRPLAVAKAVAGPQRAFTATFAPLIRHLNSAANRAVRRIGLEPAEELASARTPQELVALVRHSSERGVLEADAAELFVRTMRLGELSAENVMTPRVNVHALPATASAADVAELTRRTGHSRFPVYRDRLDEVLGVVAIREVLSVPEEERATRPVTTLLAEPLLVPATLPVDRLLDDLRDTVALAVVVDEYGGTAGVVTVEDVLEEVVGEVTDEHDPVTAPQLTQLAPGVWDADGLVRVDELDHLGVPDLDGSYETLAGMVATLLGRVPQPGDRVEAAGWRLDVLSTVAHRAERIRLTAPPADPTEPAEGSEA